MPAPRSVLALVLVIIMAASSSCIGSGDDEDGTLDDCTADRDPAVSVARVWDEVLLDAIRRDFPAPTVHSRNLFHLSAAMWDGWAAYDDTAVGYFVDEDLRAGDIGAARETAISFAAFRILAHRYEKAIGSEETLARLEATMQALCFSTEFVSAEGDSAAAFGNRIAAEVIEFGRTDGAREPLGYADRSYRPVNNGLLVTEPGATMADPNRWQPLAFEVMATQNDVELATNLQEFVGPHWGEVAGFALSPSSDGPPLDPGAPPYLGDQSTDGEFKAAAIEVIRYSATLDPDDDVVVDISPGSIGNNPLGTYDGNGRTMNPMTGNAYEPNMVARGDFGRVVAEFWADGPDSETPPGHWNTIANALSDEPGFSRRIGGAGEEVDRLEWDVKLYLALNGAVHDAAIAAWGSKGHYDYVRPISMIRYMGGLGQSDDPSGPSYHPDGLPLVDDLVEVVTVESSAAGERHRHLRDHVGEVTIRAWAGEPNDPESDVGGVDWIRAVEWVPYQRSTFVTPAFAGYVSGHSAFSRAAAEVMAGFTGSEFFPGGLGQWTIDADGLEFEAGPAQDITLQWATYYDAADQAAISRLYGGIHVRADDLQGRIIGATCGQDAWELAVRYFDGTVS